MNCSSIRIWIMIFVMGTTSCGKDKPNADKQPNDPYFITKFNEDRMAKAIAEAKSTLDQFILTLKQNSPTNWGFAIKKGFSYGSDGNEYIWIDHVRLVGNDFEGQIGNDPVYVKDLKLGQTVHVARNEVVDWMYFDNKDHCRLRGGYTTAALAYENKDLVERSKGVMNFDWSQYNFLHEKK